MPMVASIIIAGTVSTLFETTEMHGQPSQRSLSANNNKGENRQIIQI